MHTTILRLRSVLAISGYSRSTLYLRMTQGLWPKQIHLGVRAIGWPDHEVQSMNAARIAGKSDDAIRELVRRLETARKDVA